MADKAIIANGTTLSWGAAGANNTVTTPAVLARITGINPPKVSLQFKDTTPLEATELEETPTRIAYDDMTFTLQIDQGKYSSLLAAVKAKAKKGFVITYPHGGTGEDAFDGGVETIIGYPSGLEKTGVEFDGVIEATFTVKPTFYDTAPNA